MVYPKKEWHVIAGALLLMCPLTRFFRHTWRATVRPYSTRLTLVALLLTSCGHVKELPTAGERIVFFGDSITEQGELPGGYVSLIRDTLQRHAVKPSPEVIGAGVSGNRVPDLLARVDRDVLARHPMVVVVYIGINDVWHFTLPSGKGTPREEYRRGTRILLQRIMATGAHVMLCTPSVIGERYDGSNSLDPMLEEYSAISRSVASDTGAWLCDLRKSFVEYLKQHNPQYKEAGVLTIDSVHLNEAGNRFVAAEILKSLQEANLIEFHE